MMTTESTLTMMRRAGAAMVLALGLMLCGYRADAQAPKTEMRGAWLATVYGIDWPAVTGHTPAVARQQQRQLDAMLDALERAGINAVLFQVRPMADALYESPYEPWSAYLTGTRGIKAAYDPLAYCVEACHSRGMECHAWINPFRVGTKAPDTPIDRKHKPMWMTHTVKGSTMTIFNPADDKARQLLTDVCVHIARTYDIDGIVFDDYFYNPEYIPENDKAADWQHYKRSGTRLSMADWRRSNVDTTIRRVYEALQGVKDGKIRFGIAPQGIAGGNGVHQGVPLTTDYGIITKDSQYDKIYSDPVAWLRDGIVDYVSPQIYWTSDHPSHPYVSLAKWWNDVAEMHSRHCFISQNAASLAGNNSAEIQSEILAQITASRTASYDYAPGSILYSAKYITDPKYADFSSALAQDVYPTRALLPPMTWKPGVHELRLTGLKRSADTLSWDSAEDARYVIYAMPEGIDFFDTMDPLGSGLAANFIVGITYDCTFTIPPHMQSGYRFAVAPYDRYGVEWQPVYLND